MNKFCHVGMEIRVLQLVWRSKGVRLDKHILFHLQPNSLATFFCLKQTLARHSTKLLEVFGGLVVIPETFSVGPSSQTVRVLQTEII